jgi:RNA polymerase sigma factor (sigma-70 family)
MELDEELQLVAQMMSGDSYALDRFVHTYRRFITSVLNRQPSLYSHDVEELYQRFLFHIWEDGYRRLRPWSGTRSLRFYLGAIARNLARDFRRERRRIICNSVDCEMVVLPAIEPLGESSKAGMVRAALRSLCMRDRDLIHRRYYLEESYREIADAMGITVNHVGVALFRAESRLKVLLEKHRTYL